jgi:hypothetical protein
LELCSLVLPNLNLDHPNILPTLSVNKSMSRLAFGFSSFFFHIFFPPSLKIQTFHTFGNHFVQR